MYKARMSIPFKPNLHTRTHTNKPQEEDIDLQYEPRTCRIMYRNDKTSPAQSIEGPFALKPFDSDPKELGKPVWELAAIFEITAKLEGLLKAWSDWKAINEDCSSPETIAMTRDCRQWHV